MAVAVPEWIVVTADLSRLRERWRQAEARMYPLATTRPERYEQLVRIARRVADDLAGVANSIELVTAWDLHETQARESAASIDIPLGDLPVADVAAVGFALRDAEIRQIEHQREQQRLVHDARSRGDTWVRLHETGNLDQGLFDPYQSIDLHLASGAAIVASVEVDPSTGAASHVLTVIRIDPSSGVPTDFDPGIAEVQEHPDRATFERARVALVELIETR